MKATLVRRVPCALRWIALTALIACAPAFARSAAEYARTGPRAVTTVDVELEDADRQRRVPARLYVPAGEDPVPVVLFSHGLGGSRLGGKAWGEHWASHGYLSIHLQHPGSDAAVARAAVRGEGRGAAAGALTPRAFAERVHDVRFVLDLIERAPTRIHRAAARADAKRIGMSGHSYGARTTLALAAERVPFAAGEHADARVLAAIAFSPYAPPPPESWPRRFGAIRVPVLSVTGTEDRDVVGGSSAEVRREPFRHMAPGGKYLLVLGGADHMTFNGHDRGGAVDDATIHARVNLETAVGALAIG